MKREYIVLLCVIFLAGCGSRAAVVPPPAATAHERGLPIHDDIGEYSPTTLIVMCDSTVGKEPLRQALIEIGASVIYDYKIINGMAIRKPDNMTLDGTIAILKQVDGVISVSRDRITRLTDPVKPRVFDR